MSTLRGVQRGGIDGAGDERQTDRADPVGLPKPSELRGGDGEVAAAQITARWRAARGTGGGLGSNRRHPHLALAAAPPAQVAVRGGEQQERSGGAVEGLERLGRRRLPEFLDEPASSAVLSAW